MHLSSYCGAPSRVAHTLLQTHGIGSAAEAADRADERFANIDLGGFAYWKSVEKLILTTHRVAG